MNKLVSFVTERAGSLISKRVGAAAAGVSIATAAGEPVLAGWTLVAYMAFETLWKGWKYYVDARFGTGAAKDR